jgi:GT2 family glycosyltransferase
MLDLLNSDPTVGIVTAPLVMSDGKEDSASVRKLPTLGSAGLYAALGKLTPQRLRYNTPDFSYDESGVKTIQATTGALMLVNPDFRRSSQGIFDLDYWMYGEDLQLCQDARDENYKVLMIRHTPSLHEKGVSSGWPRSMKSNIAFHRAMFTYYQKNFTGTPLLTPIVYFAVQGRLTLSVVSGLLARTATALNLAPRGASESDDSKAP